MQKQKVIKEDISTVRLPFKIKSLTDSGSKDTNRGYIPVWPQYSRKIIKRKKNTEIY